jgi:hypothetical protein
MHDDLDLSVIERHHDADPQFREAVRTRLAAILDGGDAFEVPDHLPVQSTEEEATMIDLETPSEADEHGKGPKRVRLAGLLVAAAVVAIALVAIRKDDPVSPAEQPSTTVIVPPTNPPQALPNTPRTYAQLAPGTYFVDEVEGISTPRIFATVGDGWWHGGDNGFSIEKRSAYPNGEMPDDTAVDLIGATWFTRADLVFSDACHLADGTYTGSLATVDGVVTALTQQQGWAEVTAPSDISIDGYNGKAFQRTAPADISDCDPVLHNSFDDVRTQIPMLTSWQTDDHRSGYLAGSIETLWVLDIDGTVVIISTSVTPGPSAGSPDFATDVLASIRIERAAEAD